MAKSKPKYKPKRMAKGKPQTKKTTGAKNTKAKGKANTKAAPKRMAPPVKKKISPAAIAGIVVAAIAVLVIGGYFAFKAYAVYGAARVEVCTKVLATDFAKTNKFGVSFIDEKEFDTSVPGSYKVHLKVGVLKYAVTLNVMDTKAPTLELKETSVGSGEKVSPEAFVASCEDKTKVTFTYETEPDFSKNGEQEITIIATDLGNNQTKKTVKVLVTPVINKLTLEAGSEFPEATAFLGKNGGDKAEFVLPEKFNKAEVMRHVATTELVVAVDGNEFKTNLEIIDTQAPVVKAKDYEGFTLISVAPKMLIASCVDKTGVTYTYEKQPNLKLVGTQDVTIVAKDEGGNEVKVNAKITLKADTEAPVINGATDKTVYIGKTIAYRNLISVSDNSGSSNVSLKIDSSKVNLKKQGTYPVNVTATDKAGNKTTASFNVTVKERTYSQAELNELCDKILSKIIKGGMSKRQKADAIHNYVRHNLSFISSSDKSSYTKAAILAIENKKGDCFNYAALSKALLTRAGIKNSDIRKIHVNAGVHSDHYWNLVDIGDGHGWYHFDTCPRRGSSERIFLWDDARLMAFSAAHNNSHNYDHSIYTNIP